MYKRPRIALSRLGLGLGVLMLVTVRLPAQPGAPLGPKGGAGLSPTDTARVAVGTLAPDFTLEARDGARVTLSAFRGKQNVVLVFYRGHW